jgi:hypothetical protein
MSEKVVYSYKSSVEAMTAEQVRTALASAEIAFRCGALKYVEEEFFSSQTDEIKATWPEPAIQALKAKAKELSGGQPFHPKTIRQAVLSVCEEVSVARAKAAGTKERSELMALLADISLSMLFKRAPDIAIPYAGKRQVLGKTFRLRPSEAPRRMVINCDEAASADVFIYVYCNIQAKASRLLGWMSQAEVLKAKSGNKATDPDHCAWDKMAYYIPLAELRPMSEMAQKCAIVDIPSGILFETPPKEAELPSPRHDLKGMISTGPDGSDFLAICGITKPTEAAPLAVPVPQTNAAKVASQEIDL